MSAVQIESLKKAVYRLNALLSSPKTEATDERVNGLIKTINQITR